MVVDGHSTEGTAQIVDRFQVRYIFDKGKWPAAARNLALKSCCCDYVVVIDADQWVRRGFTSHLKAVKRISLERLSFGTRRMEAILTRELGYQVNRKKVQRIFHALNRVSPEMKKNEIIRSAARLQKPELQTLSGRQTSPTSGAEETDGDTSSMPWSCSPGIWLGYAFNTIAGRDNAIMSANNSLTTNPEIEAGGLTLRVDNGSQYRSMQIINSMKALGIRLEFFFANTSE